MSQSLYGAEVLTSSFSATTPHQDTVVAFYEVLNVMFFIMLFATVRFKAWPECSIFPCCFTGSVSLVVSCLLEIVCTGGKVPACKISYDCVAIWVTDLQRCILYISGILVHFPHQSGPSCKLWSIDTVFILSAEKKGELEFCQVGFSLLL